MTAAYNPIPPGPPLTYAEARDFVVARLWERFDGIAIRPVGWHRGDPRDEAMIRGEAISILQCLQDAGRVDHVDPSDVHAAIIRTVAGGITFVVWWER